MSTLKKLALPLLCFLIFHLHANTVYEIPENIRYTTHRDDASKITYYFIPHINTNKKHPIAIVCEGSSLKGELESVMRIHTAWGLHQSLTQMGLGIVTVEKRGIDGNIINEKEFFENYTRTNRFNDHCSVIEALKLNPPTGWNGKLIFIGGSEGGPLALSLTLKYPSQTIATVNWAGATDNSWPDQIWNFFHYDSWLTWLVGLYHLPWSKEKLYKKFKEIKCNPSSEKWFAGLTYRYHADVFEEEKRNAMYTKIATPLLVVTGTKDTIIDTSDTFVDKAQQAGVPITYYRVDGMGHGVIDPKFGMVEKTLQWIYSVAKLQNS